MPLFVWHLEYYLRRTKMPVVTSHNSILSVLLPFLDRAAIPFSLFVLFSMLSNRCVPAFHPAVVISSFSCFCFRCSQLVTRPLSPPSSFAVSLLKLSYRIHSYSPHHKNVYSNLQTTLLCYVVDTAKLTRHMYITFARLFAVPRAH